MDRDNNFSYEGKRALFDYLEQYEEDTETEIELDVVGLDGDFTEYDSATEAATEHGFTLPEREDVDREFTGIDPDRSVILWTDEETDEEYQERCEAEALEWLQDRTVVIECDNGHVIVQAF